MQLSDDTQRHVNVVVAYAGGEVRLRDRALRASAIVTAERVEPWQARDVSSLTPAAFDPVLAQQPEVVILATGARQDFPDPEVYAHVQGRGVGLEAMETGAACRTYNVLVAENRRVALALLIAPT